MKIDLFDYNLPTELIAQQQVKPRDHSRLLILDRDSKQVEHKHFYDLPDYLTDNDVLVLNETKVFPARLIGQKKTGGKIEVFLTSQIQDNIWECMVGGRAKLDDLIYFQDLECQVVKKIEDKIWQIKFNKAGQELEELIEQIGQTPLPPYIKTQDIDFMLNYQAPPNFAIIVPSRRFDGTNALVRMPVDLMETHYDEDSYKIHMNTAKEHTLNVAMVFIKRIMWDVDNIEDLEFLLEQNEKPQIAEKIRTILETNQK